MASFGEIAVGERRMSWPRPARSQVLGIVASALGITRVDEQEHVALERALGYGVRTDAPGRPLVDYHTAQTPKARRGQVFKTRRDELQAPQLATVLSTREWRIDSFFTVALWPRPGAQGGSGARGKRALEPPLCPLPGAQGRATGVAAQSAVGGSRFDCRCAVSARTIRDGERSADARPACCVRERTDRLRHGCPGGAR